MEDFEKAVEYIRVGKEAEFAEDIEYGEYEKAQADYTKGVKIMNSITLNRKIPVYERFKVLKKYIELDPEYGYDIVARYRDSLVHLPEASDIIQILVMLIKDTAIDSHERATSAVSLYNNGEIEVCYVCFSTLAYDRSLLVKYRVEACRYLFGSWDDECRQEALDVLLEIIGTSSLQSSFRYRIITGYISNTGIGTLLNNNKIMIGYNEPFVFELQNLFFFDVRNDVRDRILSGQHLLQMDESVSEDLRKSVADHLLQIALDEEQTVRTRADICDVLLRENERFVGFVEDEETSERVKRVDDECAAVAQEVLDKIRFAHLEDAEGFDKVRTFYNDAENVHKALPQVITAAEELYSELEQIRRRPYSDIHSRMVKLIKESCDSKEERVEKFNALNRIDIDTARFTKHSLTLAEILVLVVTKIDTYESQERKDEAYMKLLIQLEQMDDTCSSGHVSRLVGIVKDIFVWSDQVLSNLTARMQKRVADLDEEDVDKEYISELPLGFSDEDKWKEDRAKEYLEALFSDIRDELYVEFVGEDYISADDFAIYTRDAKKKIWGTFNL